MIQEAKDEIRYEYGYDNGFKIYKINKKTNKKIALTFKIHEIEKVKVLTYTYEEKRVEYLNRYEKDFFNEFTLEDFEKFKEGLKSICIKVNIEPNYGMLMNEFVNETNLKSKFEFFKYLFTSKLFQMIVECGFGYLIAENTILIIKTIEGTLCTDKNAETLDRAWGIEKKGLEFLSEKKVRLDKILYTKEFIERKGFYVFNKLFLEVGLNIEYIRTVDEILNHYYEVDKFAEYIEKIHKGEGLEKDTIIEFIADIKKISEDLNMEFSPYMDSLRWYHDKMIEMYRIKEKKDNEEILEEKGKHIKVKQVEYKYNCKVLKSLDEMPDEEEWILNYIKRMKKEKIFILRILKGKDKDIALIAMKENKALEIKSFTSIRKQKELDKYITDLGKRNSWHMKEIKPLLE